MNTFRFPDGMTSQDFLTSVWQRRPLLCRSAYSDFVLPFDPDDLFDLACEPEAQSRLILRHGSAFDVIHGPLDPPVLDDLPGVGWTLLIQSMEVWVPDLHGLIKSLDFLPHWRVDDVMVSLSVAGGGVGPHLDQYDVFLFQAKGRRSWAYGGPASPFLPDQPLRLLSSFQPHEQHDLASGDVLYLPPGVPHDGVALDDKSVTLSIGFRAPGLSDLTSKLADQHLTRWHNDAEGEPRFTDAGRYPIGDDPNAIDQSDVATMANLLASCARDPDQMMVLAGELVSEPRMPPHPPATAPEGEAIRERLEDGETLERWAGSRLAHGALTDGQSALFADGGSIKCPSDLARVLASATAIDRAIFDEELTPDAVDRVLTWLVGQGTFGFADPDQDEI